MNSACRAENCCDTPLAYEADTPAEAEDTILFANIGDYGTDGSTVGTNAVAAMVKSWGPEYITTNGDNWYGNISTQANWETLSGQMYRDYIFPYASVLGLVSTATFNNFYPTTGNHDRDPVGHLASLGYFNYPQVFRNGAWGASTGYYKVRRGFVEHFFYDSGFDNSQVNRQADGVDLASAQATWLQTSLAASDARWKIVHSHHPGYTSTRTGGVQPTLTGDGYLSYTAIRNLTQQLKAWGADVLLHGHCHNYERLSYDGFPVIINGTAGRVLEGFTGPIHPLSLFRHQAFGAIKGTATCRRLSLEWFDTNEVLQDSLILTKS